MNASITLAGFAFVFPCWNARVAELPGVPRGGVFPPRPQAAPMNQMSRGIRAGC